MLVNALLLLTIELRRRVIRRRIFDGLASQVDGDFCLGPTHCRDPLRRDEHLVAAPPIAGVHNQVANRPGVLVNEEVLDVAKIAVGCVDMMSDDIKLMLGLM